MMAEFQPSPPRWAVLLEHQLHADTQDRRELSAVGIAPAR